MLNRLNENKKVVDEGLKLYPNLIRMQCSDAEDALTKEMEKLDRVLESIDRFAIDNSNSGKAIDAVKAHLNEYKLVITAQKSACEGDIFEYRKFKEDVKSEILLGDEINEKYRYAAHMYNENMEKAERYMKIYEADISPCANHYLSQSRNYENLANTYKMQATVWEEKGQELTEINELTADPISTSKALKAKVKSGLSALGRAFDGSTFKSCIGSEWINGINSDMKNMAQKMAIGNGKLEGKSDAEIARVCKKPYADMTALEKMEWQNIENYIVNCNIDSKKKVDFINLVLKSCTLKKGRLANSAITEYEFNDKIPRINKALYSNLTVNSPDSKIRNSIVWGYLQKTSSICGIPRIKIRDICYDEDKVKGCIDVTVYDKRTFFSPQYSEEKLEYTIFPIRNIKQELGRADIEKHYSTAKGDQIEKKIKINTAATALMGVGELPVKYGMTIPFSIVSTYFDEKANAKTHYDTASFVERLSKLKNENCKGMIVENPKCYPHLELISDKESDSVVKSITGKLSDGIEMVEKGVKLVDED